MPELKLSIITITFNSAAATKDTVRSAPGRRTGIRNRHLPSGLATRMQRRTTEEGVEWTDIRCLCEVEVVGRNPYSNNQTLNGTASGLGDVERT